ncbi:MAG: hypothetical protein M3541_17920 [Acidobacteriota bacterium]|nr:hypothetical protein [Acidobacteriota bacterium]MDQ3420620.1 hypothetical protein [Acidobacteriota bacterium]
MKPIKLLPCVSHVTAAKLTRTVEGDICACDFYVEGAEAGVEVPGGYQLNGILNIDHHAPGTRMARVISSANLAIAHVRQCGLPAGQIVINHTDCDSILSSGVAAGRLDPAGRFGEAAIAADHTGKENNIADLLQGLDHKRDVELSFSNLERLLAGQALDGVAQAALDTRRRKRKAAEDVVKSGQVSVGGGMAFGVLREVIDGEFFPELLPDAIVILVASKVADTDLWKMKLRLGLAAPEGFNLHALGLQSFDPGYGGRWNAGSNSRAGGTVLTPEDYAEKIRARLASWPTPETRAQ